MEPHTSAFRLIHSLGGDCQVTRFEAKGEKMTPDRCQRPITRRELHGGSVVPSSEGVKGGLPRVVGQFEVRPPEKYRTA